MNVLVLNCGSSSLKFQVVATDAAAMEADADRVLARGLVERIGSESLLTLTAGDGPAVRSAEPLRDHRAALEAILRWLVGGAVPGINSPGDVHAIGHRIVHGADKLTAATLLDDAAIRTIEACIDLAPLHNPANIKGIVAARAAFGSGVPQVGVFDTAFHSTMPETVVPVRHPVPDVRAPPGAPLRLPRHVAPLRGLALPQARRHRARGDERRQPAPGQRRVGLRHQGGRLDRHDDGDDPARGPGHGHALAATSIPGSSSTCTTRRACRWPSSTRCSTSSRGCWASRA